MSDGYIGVSAPNRVSAAFQKEDFLGSALGTISVGGTTYSNAKELDTDVDGANTENLHVVLDNVVQEPDVAYLIHENASSQPRIIQFTEAVPSTASIYVIHRGIGSTSMKPPTGSVGPDQLTDTMKGFTTDTFTANGSTAAFTLSETPPNANSVLVFADGILQKITTNYTISTNTLTFTSNPANLTEIEVKHMGVRGVMRRGPDYQYDAFTGDGSDTTFTLTHTGVPTNSAFVFYNGIALKPTADYSISGQVLTTTFAPQNASEIMVRYQI
jgi:hypothetical protein